MKMPNGAEKKRQATDNRLRNAPLENIPDWVRFTKLLEVEKKPQS